MEEKPSEDAKEKLKFYTGDQLNEPFTKEHFERKWIEYLERLDDRPTLKVTLSRIPMLEEGNKLLLKVDNNLLSEEVAKIKPDLVSWLRKELKNTNIELLTEVAAQERNSKPYSEKEKLEEMVRKNPNLNLLKQIFNLDLGDV